MSHEVSEADFEALVAAALDEIPDELGREIENVAVVVEDWPPPGSRLLGLYEGVPLTKRGPLGYSGVTVWNPQGKLLGRIRLPEVCGNLTFGGPKRNRLFMAASQSVYALYVNTQGALGG